MWRKLIIALLISLIGVQFVPTKVHAQPCAYPRLSRGYLAQVSEDGGYNNVRSRPDLQAQLVGQLAPGTTVAVIGGPYCRDSFNWWQVRSGDLIGWTADGDQDEAWLNNLHRRIPEANLTPTDPAPPLWTPQSDAVEIPPLLPPGGTTATPTPVIATRIPPSPTPSASTSDALWIDPAWFD